MRCCSHGVSMHATAHGHRVWWTDNRLGGGVENGDPLTAGAAGRPLSSGKGDVTSKGLMRRTEDVAARALLSHFPVSTPGGRGAFLSLDFPTLQSTRTAMPPTSRCFLLVPASCIASASALSEHGYQSALSNSECACAATHTIYSYEYY